jgi:P4 family phage/plasmid primase-like protien
VKVLTNIYQEIIKDIVPPSQYKEIMLTCVILEKSGPRVSEGVIKDGWHYHFPYFFADAWVQDHYIRNIVMKKVTEQKLFDGLKLLEGVDKIIDPIATKTWLMYGSSKSLESEPYVASKFINGNLEDISIEEAFAPLMAGKRSSPSYYFPQFLSIQATSEPTPLLDKVNVMKASAKADKKTRRKRKAINKTRSEADAMADLKMLEDGEIMSMLSLERSNSYGSWMDVGWTLFSVGQGCQKALNMWINFSRASEKYKEGECELQWDTMEVGPKTVGSILRMANMDSPGEFIEWKNMNIRFLLKEACKTQKPAHYPIARVMHKMYENRFVLAKSKGDKWYEFRNHRWNYVDNGISIKKLIPSEVANKFRDYISECSKYARMEEPGSPAQKKYDILVKKAYTIIEKLYDDGFQNKVVKQCQMFFHDETFLDKMNENSTLVGFENGVYDLKLGLFRSGHPDDCITMSTKINYKKFDWEDEEVKNVQTYLDQVFPNYRIKEYFQDVVASCLQGGNVNKIFAIMTGNGNNSKSIMVDILESCFGDYIFKFPRELFVVGAMRNGSGPKPELTRTRGKRIAVTQEIAKTEKIHIGALKEHTGNDGYYARSHHEEGGEIKPMYTLFLACNLPPIIPGHDDATWARVRKIDYQSKFTHDAPDDEDEQIRTKTFPIDPDFRDKIPDMAEPFMWMLTERFKIYKKNGLNAPSEVLSSTNSYKTRNDIYLQFVQQRIKKIDNEKEHIRLTEMFSSFKEWYYVNHPSYSKDKIGKNEMKDEINKRLTDMKMPPSGKQSRWWGYAFADKVDDEE